jgi:hypothetical protein
VLDYLHVIDVNFLNVYKDLKVDTFVVQNREQEQKEEEEAEEEEEDQIEVMMLVELLYLLQEASNMLKVQKYDLVVVVLVVDLL